ncbi:MAG: RNA polymerase sigma factor [Solirubrobacteraceae bacterium]
MICDATLALVEVMSLPLDSVADSRPMSLPARHPPPAESPVTLSARLRVGDEPAFRELLDSHSASILQLALVLCPSRAAAERVAQEAWMEVIADPCGLQGHCSPREWIFGILARKAKARTAQGRRPFSFEPLSATHDAGAACVDAKRFLPADDPHAQQWATPPRPWPPSHERCLGPKETARVLREALEHLDPMQRLVVVMRDREGWEATEVCLALDISEARQRVLLRLARARVHAALEQQFDPDSHG